MSKEKSIDAEEELSKILQGEIDKMILQKLARYGFEDYANGVKAENREGKLNSILEDKDFTEINIEETQMFKLLSEEDKEKWRKNGRLK